MSVLTPVPALLSLSDELLVEILALLCAPPGSSAALLAASNACTRLKRLAGDKKVVRILSFRQGLLFPRADLESGNCYLLCDITCAEGRCC